MIRPLDIAQQSLATDTAVRGPVRPGGSAAALAADGLNFQTEDWFAQTTDIAVSASRSHESVEAHAERVLSHLLSQVDG